MDEEVGEGDVGGHHIGLDTGHTGRGRTGPYPVEEAVDALVGPLGEQLDPSVREIANPTHQIERTSGVAAALAVANSLDVAGDEGVNRFGHGDGWQLGQK